MTTVYLISFFIVAYLYGRKLERIHEEIADLRFEFDKKFNPPDLDLD